MIVFLALMLFEHILGLPEVIRELSSHIKPGGSLIFSGAF